MTQRRDDSSLSLIMPWSSDGRLLQRVRGRPASEPDEEVPELQQGFRQVRRDGRPSMSDSAQDSAKQLK